MPTDEHADEDEHIYAPPGSRVVAALGRAYNNRHRAVIDAAGTPSSVHIRIIDPAFAKLTYAQRETLITNVLKEQFANTDDPDFAEVVSLHLVTPAEPMFAVVDRFNDIDLACLGSLATRGKEHYAWRANSFDEMSSAATGRFMLVFINLWLMCRDLCYCAAIVARKLWH